MNKQQRTVNKVLIVDDHPIVCEGLRQLIDQEEDFTVCGIEEDVAGALRAIDNLTPDVVIVDLNLRDDDGLRLIALRPELPMLVLSMHETSHYVKRALDAGARGYLTKQEASEKVLQALRDILSGEIYLGSLLPNGSQLQNPEPTAAGDPVRDLSKREFEVFWLIGKTDHGTRKISQELGISIKTVESHKRNIKQKIGLASATELTRFAMRWFERNDPS